MKHYDALHAILDNMRDDTAKFYGGNNAAGVRLRRQLQNLKKEANEMRNDIQSVKASRKEK